MLHSLARHGRFDYLTETFMLSQCDALQVNLLRLFCHLVRKYILEQFAQEEETTFLQSFRQSIDTLQFQMQSFVQDAEYCTS